MVGGVDEWVRVGVCRAPVIAAWCVFSLLIVPILPFDILARALTLWLAL